MCLASGAEARELVRSETGVVFDGSGFYKTLLSGLLLNRGTVESTRALSSLLDEARALAPPGVELPQSPPVPDAGVLNGHLLRLAAKLRVSEHLEADVAWQLALQLASDPVFAGGSSVYGAVGAAEAQRRLVGLSGVLAQGRVARLDHDLDRLSVKLALPFGDLTVGRQVLSWGTGRLWNPTDVLSPFPPTAVDREVRRGFDVVRLAVALSEVSQLDLLYLPQRALEDNGGVVRVQANLLGWDGSLSLGKYVRDIVAGADLVGDLGPIGVHAEGAYTLELLDLREGPVRVGEHFFRGVVGAEARPHEKVLVMAEYSYNGFGTTHPSEYARTLSSPRVVRGEIFGAGKHSAALGASLLASDLLTAQLSVLCNLTDPSALLIPSVEYSIT
ncbi:MAG: hypothetical protein ACYC8T_22740, partial [Myxococcaceae bacterium]